MCIHVGDQQDPNYEHDWLYLFFFLRTNMNTDIWLNPDVLMKFYLLFTPFLPFDVSVGVCLNED